MDNDDDRIIEKLNLDELYNEKKIEQDNRLKTYNKILKRVHQKIKHTSRQKNSLCFCCFVIPEFLLGTPRYDSGACIAYIIDKLKENGFSIKYTHPNLLFISWAHYIPPYVRSDYKKKTGIAVDGFGNLLKSKNKKKDSDNPNELLAKDKPTSILKKPKHNFKKISNYKPSGSIYNTELIRKIENNVSRPGDQD